MKWSGSIHIRESSNLTEREENHRKKWMGIIINKSHCSDIERMGGRGREDRMFSFETEISHRDPICAATID